MYTVSHEKIKIWAGEFFPSAKVTIEDRADIDRIHLILKVRNIRMSEHEKFVRWFYEEYDRLLDNAHISGGGMLTTKEKFLVQFILPRTVEE